MELIIDKQFQVAAYQPFYSQLIELEKQNSELAFDYESSKGNKEARSHVYKLRQSKAALEKTRKDEKAESLRIGKAIDSEAKEIEARIEAMIEVHQVKLDEIESRETSRIAAIKSRIETLKTYVQMLETIGSEDLATGISELEQIAIDDSFQEFSAEAAQAKDARLIHLRVHLEVVKDREAQAIELERLRQEAAERAQKERDEAIAKAAAEQAKREADALAARKEVDAKAAIEAAEAKAKAEREAAERRELQLKLEAENAERRRVEAEQNAIKQAKEAAERAEREKVAAVSAEKARIEAAERAAAEEQAKREANKKHCAAINNAAKQAFIDNGLDEETAKLVIRLIAQGIVPAVSIQY